MSKSYIKLEGPWATLPGITTVVFVALKMFGAVTWPWLWVVSPLWISMAVASLLLMLCVAIAVMRGR
jgi:hypothetical protein